MPAYTYTHPSLEMRAVAVVKLYVSVLLELPCRLYEMCEGLAQSAADISCTRSA